MSTLNLARFPISGRKEFPSAEEYELEAALLRREARTDAVRRTGQFGGNSPLYAFAKAFERTARRKRWSEQTSRSHRQEAAA